jgi:hypothetical protein
MTGRLTLAFLLAFSGNAAALLDVGAVAGFDARPPAEADPVFGLSLGIQLGPASLYSRGTIMPTDAQDSPAGAYVDEWKRRYYSGDVTARVKLGAKETAPVVGLSYRQSRFSDYDYEGGESGGVSKPLSYNDAKTTHRRVLALGGVNLGDEEITTLVWGGVGAAFKKRTGLAWTQTPPPESKRTEWSLDAEWKTLEIAAGGVATYRVTNYFGIAGGFELSNRLATLDGEEAADERPFGVTLYFAPTLHL